MELSCEELNSLLVLTAVQRGKMGEDIKCGRIESKEWENNSPGRAGLWLMRRLRPERRMLSAGLTLGPVPADIPTSLPLEPPVSTVLTAPTSPALGGEN